VKGCRFRGRGVRSWLTRSLDCATSRTFLKPSIAPWIPRCVSTVPVDSHIVLEHKKLFIRVSSENELQPVDLSGV